MAKRRIFMKTAKRITAIFLTVIMLFSLGNMAFAAKQTLYTETFLSELSKTKKIYAKVTAHTYDNITNTLDFDFYGDLNTGKIGCVLNNKGVKAVYDGGKVSCALTWFRLFISADMNNVPYLGSTFENVERLQSVISSFLDNPDLSDFYATVTTETVDGQTCTCEKLTGKLVPVSATFCYNEKGGLCKLYLTDTLGESISFSFSEVKTDFDSEILTIPDNYFDVSFIWKLISFFFNNK